jgi:hypothetical protein
MSVNLSQDIELGYEDEKCVIRLLCWLVLLAVAACSTRLESAALTVRCA